MPWILNQYLLVRYLTYLLAIFVIFKALQWILGRPSLHVLNFYIKYGLYHLYVVIVAGLALLPAVLRPGNSDNIVLARIGFHLSQMAWLFGVKIETAGKELIDNVKKPVIFMSNHQTSLDVMPIAKVSSFLMLNFF